MAAPGVVVSTATRSGPTGVVRAQSGQYFAVGLAERGPTTAPVKINSMGDYKRIFGDRVTYGGLFDDLTAYFETGGSQAFVLRAVGAAATIGLLTVADGSAQPTLKFEAASAGSWSSRITVQVELGSNGATTRKVTVRLDGVIVEVFNNLTTVAEVVSRFVGSAYVKVTDLGSATVAPGNLPAVTAATALSAGTDDRAAVNAARIEALLPLLKVGLGDGAVAVPGFGATIHNALIAHAKDYRRVAILSAARGATAADLAAAGLALGTTSGSHHAGLFGPHILVSDSAGGTRVISPEGYVAASRNKAHNATGPWQAGAGEFSLNNFVLGLDQEFTKAEAEVMDAGRVNPIRLVANRIRIYGWRSLSSNETDYASLTVQDTLNRLVTECERRLEPFVFRVIDGRGQLLSQMQGVLIGVLEPIRAVGGIFERIDPTSGEQLDAGYFVDVSPNINSVTSLATNEVKATISARLSPNASLISLTIVKVGLAAGV